MTITRLTFFFLALLVLQGGVFVALMRRWWPQARAFLFKLDPFQKMALAVSAFGLATAYLLAFTAGAFFGSSHIAPERRYSTEVAIHPSGDNALFVWARVTDLASREVRVGPRIKISDGETVSADSVLPDGTVITLSASAKHWSRLWIGLESVPAKRLATYSVTLKKGDQVLSSHNGNIAL